MNKKLSIFFNLFVGLLLSHGLMADKKLEEVISEKPGNYTLSIDTKYSSMENSSLSSYKTSVGNIYAIEFVDFASGKMPVIQFTTNLPPVWGDFYANATNSSYAYNADFGSLKDVLPKSIPQPGSGSLPAQEPMVWQILGIGLLTSMFVKRMRGNPKWLNKKS